MSPIHEDLTLEEVAALVCSTLERHGVRVVLSGGSAVSIYSDNEYRSDDLDFIQTGLSRRVDAAMQGLGFAKRGGIGYTSGRAIGSSFRPGRSKSGVLS